MLNWFIADGDPNEIRQVPDKRLAESDVLRMEDILRSENSTTISRPFRLGTIGSTPEETQRSISTDFIEMMSSNLIHFDVISH